MRNQTTLQSGDKVVALSSLARSVGVVCALAAAICYQIIYGVPDFLTMLTLLLPALFIGVIVGFLVSVKFVSDGPDGSTTIAKHGRDGVPVTVRTSLAVATTVAVIFILIAKLGLGFDGSLIGLVATIALPAFLVATGWALLGSLA